MATLVAIGEFARLTHLSVKTLRHYHDVDVLVPAEVDPSSGYRRYDVDEQLMQAHLVRRLRELDMPLPEVRTVLAAPDAAARDEALSDHLRRMERELDRTRGVVASLRALLAPAGEPPAVDLVELAPTHAVAARATITMDDIEDWAAETFMRLFALLADAGVPPSGPAGSLFDEGFFAEGGGEFVGFVPVDPAARASLDADDVVVVDGGHHAMAVHVGAYRELDRTYGALGRHVAAERTARDAPLREHYLVGPLDAPVADMRTQVLWPITP